MKKTIYEGWADNNFYSFNRFRTFILEEGADETLCHGAQGNYGVYHLRDVTVAWIYKGYTSSVSGCGNKCRIDLMGEEFKIGEVEKIILAEDKRISNVGKVHFGMQG